MASPELSRPRNCPGIVGIVGIVKIARVAVARKLAAICWLRLMRWHYAAGKEERAVDSCAVMGGSDPILGTGGR